MASALVTGFDIATTSGPLSEEPMLGAVFLIETIELIRKDPKPLEEGEEEKKGNVMQDSYGPFAG